MLICVLNDSQQKRNELVEEMKETVQLSCGALKDYTPPAWLIER